MFITNSAFRSPLSDYIENPTVNYWSAMELGVFRPWFMVSYRQSHSEGGHINEISRTIFLTDVQSVEQIVQQEGGGAFLLDSVQIISPSHMNGTLHWKMEILRAIWSAPEPEAEGQTADVFETSDGLTYVYSMLGTSIDELKSKTLRFLAPPISL